MDLRRLKTFAAVAEHGTVSEAAKVLHTTQPALSRQIADLQLDLGLRLFDRVGRRLVLTAEGEQILDDCRALLIQAGMIKDRAQSLRRGDAGTLRVVASPQILENVLPEFLHVHAARDPDVKIKLIEAAALDHFGMLERGEVHLAITVIQADYRGFGKQLLPPIEVVAACHPSLPVADGPVIEIQELAPYPLLLPNRGFATRRMVDAACRLAGIKPTILIECGSPHTLLALAEANHGVALIPSSARITHRNLRLTRVAYQGKLLQSPLAVLWDRRRLLPRYAATFSQALDAFMRKAPIAEAAEVPVKTGGKARAAAAVRRAARKSASGLRPAAARDHAASGILKNRKFR
jgi:DNA-binding transcriptional LysR family regulator